MTKSVCIVGAGPSGLVAAKTLLHDAPCSSSSSGSGSGDSGAGAEPFRITVFDGQARVGGLWPARADDDAGLVHPRMLANQSKHTVSFSDLAWDAAAPEFPRAWQVGRYLDAYRRRYLEGRDDVRFELGRRVVGAELGANGRWTVRTEGTAAGDAGGGTAREEVFDYLLVASGFFGTPVVPEGIPSSPGVPVVHSSKYRDLTGLLSKTEGKGGKILVVGGQMSGVEIAGTIASHLSFAVNSPDGSPVPNPDKYSIHHVVQKPAWNFPLFTSPKPGQAAAPFLPMDMSAYNLNNRPHPLVNTQGHLSVDAAKTMHSIFKATLGTDQSEFSPELKIDGDQLEQPPWLACSDWYMDFVRDGLITPIKGRFASLDGTMAGITTTEAGARRTKEIDDIAAVVLATGFDASPSLAYLPARVRETLSHDPASTVFPVALALHGTHHPALPTLGFVGFYRSPYWGVMEMQARAVAHLWCAGGGGPTGPLANALAADAGVARTLALRADPARASQFPMGDYAFLMQELGAAVGLAAATDIDPPEGTPPLPHNDRGMRVLTPALYAAAGDGRRAEAGEARRRTHALLVDALTRGRFAARAVFRSLLGEWALERRVRSALPSHPSGRFVGTARFLLREGTADGRAATTAAAAAGSDGEAGGGERGLEYLYVEEGEFRADNGLVFTATRRYVWRYDEAEDRLSVWFVRTDDDRRADYLFHELEFAVPDEGDEDRGWKATAGHLCVQDFYDVGYEFRFNAVNLRDWRIAYAVKGPKKDYKIEGSYRRKARA